MMAFFDVAKKVICSLGMTEGVLEMTKVLSEKTTPLSEKIMGVL